MLKNVAVHLLVKDAELELCKDDNEQLMTQYEREKHLRKSAEQVKLFNYV